MCYITTRFDHLIEGVIVNCPVIAALLPSPPPQSANYCMPHVLLAQSMAALQRDSFQQNIFYTRW